MNTRRLPGRLHIAAFLCMALAGATLPAQAAKVGVAAGAGTLGAGLSLTVGVNEKLNGRVGFGRLTADDEFEESGVRYNAELTLGGIYALLDWHPGASGFRVSGGLVLNDNELLGNAILTGNVEIGNTTYTPAQVGTLQATIGFDDVAPYIGIGWGNAASGERGVGFSFDLGVMLQGDADVDLVASNPAVSQADLQQEEQNLQRELDEFVNLDVYPVASLGISFSF